VPMTMASVLSGFIDRPLRSSQCCIAVKQSDSVGTDIASLSPMYSCVSSACPCPVFGKMPYIIMPPPIIGRIGIMF